MRLLLFVLMLVVLRTNAFAEVGDPLRGQAVFLDRDLGHCVLCHRVRTLDTPFQGNIGPDLSDVGQRLSRETLRSKIIDPSVSNPNTTMPAYHRISDLRQVQAEYRDQPILSLGQIDDLVAYLQTLGDES